MAGPLEGFRVIDFSRGIAGARMTWLLADYGADVIWVEPPGGDPWRAELAVPYSVYNRNKRSVELDLHDHDGRDAALGLLETADVLVETWRPGVAEGLGLDYETVRNRAPGLVYCSISGYGPGSEHDELPGYTALVHAGAGMSAAQFGHREGPIFLGLPQACNGAAYMALVGVLAALYRREEDGCGRRVETSLVDGVLAYMAQGWGYGEASAAVTGVAAFGTPRFVTRTFLCADDEWLGLSTFGRGAFDRLMEVLGLDDRVPPVDDGNVMAQLSPEEAAIVFNEVPGIFLSQPRKVWLERLLEADVAAIPALRPGEVFDEPQTVHNGMVTEVLDPVLGKVEQVSPPVRFASTPGTVRSPAPTAGQHTDRVLDDLRSGMLMTTAIRTSGVPDVRPLLDGVKVLDLGHWYAGPFSSRLLADLGADVIKLEPPAGDGMRGFDRAFAAAQAGKRAIAADLKDPELAQLRHELLQWADVVHHNLRMGVAERLGLGYEQVREINPDIVYLGAPGWGSSGPETLRQSFAPLMSGYVGAAYELGGLHNPPIYPAANEDSGAGMLGGVSLIMALLNRRRTRSGQYVELPQLNSTIADVAHIVRRPDGSVLGTWDLDPLQLGVGPLERLYQTADGWICLVAPKDEEVRGLGKVLNRELLSDERFSTPALRAHSVELEQMLSEFFAGRTTDGVVAELRANAVPVIVPLMDGNRAAMDNSDNERIGRVGVFDHPRFGTVHEVAVPYRVSDTLMPAHRRAPEFGEHTEEILAWAGYSADAIARLRERGAIR